MKLRALFQWRLVCYNSGLAVKLFNKRSKEHYP